MRVWRKATRSTLLSRRRALPPREKKRATAAVTAVLAALVPRFAGRRVGFYWPMKGEIDLVAFMRGVAHEIDDAALPVVVQKHQPLEFWRWTPRAKLCSRGLWNIPSPVERVLVEPDVLLVPLIGFDETGFRLGYGGGYYDRTLAALTQPAFVVGIGHELGRLATIAPQPHDVPMNAIVTERGVAHFAAPRR